jgi:hypothetical protein
MKMTVAQRISRRRVLRGLLHGAGVAVALPMLDCFLNESGTAFAASLGGGRLPTLFGTWFWPLGMAPGQWEPDATGTDFKFGPQLQALNGIKSKVNLYSGLQVFLDGKAHEPHATSVGVAMTGRAMNADSGYARSLDEAVAAQFGGRTRFPSLTVACDGATSSTWSARGPGALNPAEISPLALYRKVFSDGFADPNAADFKADPRVLARRSVLSAVADERQALMRQVGVRDRERLDSMFTSVRDLEQRLELESQKPEPLEACSLPQAPKGENPGLVVDDALHSHTMFVHLLSHALACGQTRIFNIVLSKGATQMHRVGETSGFHLYSHEEAVDSHLHYQPHCDWFNRAFMAAFVEMVTTLDGYKEGDHTLLDRSLVLAYTDHGEARLHSLKNLMMMTAGSAGGGMMTGYHVAGTGDPCTRVALTCQRALGLGVSSWGSGSNEVSEPYGELLHPAGATAA